MTCISNGLTRCITVRYRGALITIPPHKTARTIVSSGGIARCRTILYGANIIPDKNAVLTITSNIAGYRTMSNETIVTTDKYSDI